MAKSIAFVPDSRTIERIEATYKTLNAGASRAVESWMILRARTLDELKGKFSRGELCYLIDLCNSRYFDPSNEIRVDSTIHEIEDGNSLDGMGKKWGVEIVVFVKKLSILTAAQVFFLNEWSKTFWEAGYHEKKEGLEKYCAEMEKSGVRK